MDGVPIISSQQGMAEQSVRLTVTGMRLRAQGRLIVEDFSVSIGPGCTAVVGPDAQCGRALLRVLAGVAKAERQGLVLDGRPLSARQLRHAVCSPFRPLGARRTARFPAFPPAVDRPPGDSAGTRPWRGILHAAWQRRCRLVVMDQPTEGCDPEQGAAFWADLALVLRSDAGPAAAVVTTTRLDEVERHCGAVIVLAGGRIAFQGAVAELRSLAADKAHSLPAEVSEGAIAVGGDAAIPAPTDRALPLPPHGEVRRDSLLEGYVRVVEGANP